MTDGDAIKLARRFDALMWKARKIIEAIADSDHPNAEAMSEDLDSQCAIYAWPTHVISHHLEHPDRFECGDFGIRRKKKED
jgi:hypothetical protein